jgi:hypothetical protein
MTGSINQVTRKSVKRLWRRSRRTEVSESTEIEMKSNPPFIHFNGTDPLINGVNLALQLDMTTFGNAATRYLEKKIVFLMFVYFFYYINIKNNF